MGLRFRKSVKICNGVKLNFSKSGISTSLGGRGCTLNIRKGKPRLTVGIPNSGISYSTTFNTKSTTRKKKHYNLLIDLILICCTGGLWIIWMLIRPKYEY